MIELKSTGTRRELLEHVVRLYPVWDQVWTEIRGCVGPVSKKEVWHEQAAAIGFLASQYKGPDVRVLEIGCNLGLTAGIMQLAAPHALVTTLEPDPTNRPLARSNIVPLGVVVRPETSAAYLALTEGSGVLYDLIFVDGDHKHIALDLPWWNRLKIGGLFLHHDYSPLESGRPCPPVYDALNGFAAKMGREPEVLLVDDTGVGLWGMYRKAGDPEWVAGPVSAPEVEAEVSG